MKTTCSYCSMTFDALDSVCPYCGAPNENAARELRRNGNLVPRTIEELKNFCVGHNMPLERMRFFIGRDYRGPRAFGIYRDANGEFIVYKNKSDGTRSIRYRGRDEARAVSELYLKLKEEVSKRNTVYSPPSSTSRYSSRTSVNRSYNGSRSSYHASLRGYSIGCLSIFFIMFALMTVFVIVGIFLPSSPSTGYYNYKDDIYYYQKGSWYIFDQPSYAWQQAVVDETLLDNYEDYYSSYSWDDDYDAVNFYDSEYYTPSSSSSSYYDNDRDDWDDDWDDDTDWDYDYDSWDSDDTDWDSDW